MKLLKIKMISEPWWVNSIFGQIEQSSVMKIFHIANSKNSTHIGIPSSIFGIYILLLFRSLNCRLSVLLIYFRFGMFFFLLFYIFYGSHVILSFWEFVILGNNLCITFFFAVRKFTLILQLFLSLSLSLYVYIIYISLLFLIVEIQFFDI